MYKRQVQAGGKLGTSGNTGTRTTGEHLHFGVANFYADGTKRDIDPAAYLTEIAKKGNIKLEVLHNGNSPVYYTHLDVYKRQPYGVQDKP